MLAAVTKKSTQAIVQIREAGSCRRLTANCFRRRRARDGGGLDNAIFPLLRQSYELQSLRVARANDYLPGKLQVLFDRPRGRSSPIARNNPRSWHRLSRPPREK